MPAVIVVKREAAGVEIRRRVNSHHLVVEAKALFALETVDVAACVDVGAERHRCDSCLYASFRDVGLGVNCQCDLLCMIKLIGVDV